jgi:RHH-type proline utilization regulon transcriptional repressor/proline dehydrogenase/delta 1-pyrroline-5-carboxylate dehydrogenase
MEELVPRVADLAAKAAEARMGFNIDAEEADRLDLSLDVIEAVLADERLAGWDGFGVVVQAYGKRAGRPSTGLCAGEARPADHGAPRQGRLLGHRDQAGAGRRASRTSRFSPARRRATSYICCARKLLGMTDRIYPQFATHNAHTVAAILEMAGARTRDELRVPAPARHGRGAAPSRAGGRGTRCRIYAPVGAHRDLLAYLVRRLLENGANSSFVNQIVDEDVPVAEIVADPFAEWAETRRPIRASASRRTCFSRSAAIRRVSTCATATTSRQSRRRGAVPGAVSRRGSTDAGRRAGEGGRAARRNPADPSDIVGTVAEAGQGRCRPRLTGARLVGLPGREARRGAAPRRRSL